MELPELIKKAAEPHLVASAKEANQMLASLNAIIADMRAEVAELELASDLHRNSLLRAESGTVALKESEFRISEPYKLWKKRNGELVDLRAIRRSLERHCELLMNQEKYAPKNYDRVL